MKKIMLRLLAIFLGIIILGTVAIISEYIYMFNAERDLEKFYQTNFQEVLLANELSNSLERSQSNMRELMLEYDSNRPEEIALAYKNLQVSQHNELDIINRWKQVMQKEVYLTDDVKDRNEEFAQIEKIKEIQLALISYYNDVNQFFKFYQSGELSKAESIFEERIEPDFRMIAPIIKNVNVYSKDEAKEDIERVYKNLKSTFTFSGISLYLIIFIISVLGYFLTRNLVKQLGENIANLHEAKEKLSHMARHDILTNLPNRLFFEEELKRVTIKSKRHNQIFALLIIDVDRFKSINDTYGHKVGDLVLKEVAKRQQKIVRAEDIVARVGGDEFMAILTEIKEPRDAGLVAQRLVKALNEPYIINDQKINTSISIGIANFPESARTSEDMIKQADIALYHAKNSGRNNYKFFNAEIGAQHQEKLEIENYLHNAVEKDELFLVYQPLFSTKDHVLKGLEVLIRWQHPKLGLVEPNVFIPIAETRGLIISIGDWILKTACREFSKMRSELPDSCKLYLNISPYQLVESFPEKLSSILSKNNIAPNLVELEITETAIMTSLIGSEDILNELNRLGVKVVIDDFGTGYSSLSRLESLPISTLKIDQSFIQNLAKNVDDEIIVSSILALAEKLKLDVVAEGVETEQQLEFLQQNGCPNVQGYYLSKPLKDVDIMRYLKEHQTK